MAQTNKARLFKIKVDVVAHASLYQRKKLSQLFALQITVIIATNA
jgi:hypothetical protein